MTKEMTTGRARVCVLLSGGIDSTACVQFYQEVGCQVSAAYIDYGQKSCVRELYSSRRVAEHYNILLNEFVWTGRWKQKSGTIDGRNAFFIAGAIMEMSSLVDIIAFGIHSGTKYFDCSLPFYRMMERLTKEYTSGRVHIGAPFRLWSKKDIWDYCRQSGVPLDLTYSCEYGLNQPCGKCPSCKDLKLLYASS
jgi:7-cyano-7-deazaguanine synthase